MLTTFLDYYTARLQVLEYNKYSISQVEAISSTIYRTSASMLSAHLDQKFMHMHQDTMPVISYDLPSGVARPGLTRACVLPSTSQALPSPTQLESRDSRRIRPKLKKYTFILLC